MVPVSTRLPRFSVAIAASASCRKGAFAGLARSCSPITSSKARPMLAIRINPQASGMRAMAAKATSPPSLCPMGMTQRLPS